MNGKFHYLTHRKFISVKGKDRSEFCQNIITNDITSDAPIVASCLLTPNGRYIADFFVIKYPDELILDCHESQYMQVGKILRAAKLSAAVQLTIKQNYFIYADFSGENGLIDPRNAQMGARFYTEIALENSPPSDEYLQRRIALCIPEGDDDFGQDALLMNYPVEECHYISFQKGCFVGQEITARMKYRHLAKFILTNMKKNHNYKGEWRANANYLNDNQEVCGRICSVYGDDALVLLKKSKENDE